MNSIIKFVLDDNIVEIDFIKENRLKPTITVLNYLRGLSNHKGVKEGCAEGDCGSCTVVVGEFEEKNITYKAIDSCLVFLPMLHGKHLITVENLSFEEKGKKYLHPVQQTMIDAYGSQCGYCTPGFIMSLFALYKNHKSPTLEIIEDALTGNLCRCTGYKAIIDAAFNACKGNGKDKFTEKEKDIILLLKNINNEKTPITIETEKQRYFKPFTLDDALVLRKHYPSAIIVNGATDIALRQTKKNELLKEIIDLSDVSAMQKHSENDEGTYFGAGIPLEKLKELSKDKFPPFYSILNIFGSLQIRNYATLGGNVGSASPIGDMLPILIAYKAKIILQNIPGKREVEIEKFIKGYRKTDLKSDELITSVFIPKTDKNIIIKSYKVSKRKDLDISTVSAAFTLEINDGKIKNIIIAFGGMSDFTKRAKNTEEFLTGKEWNRKNIEDAMKMLYNEFTPISDARSGDEFRKLAARNLLMKFYNDTK